MSDQSQDIKVPDFQWKLGTCIVCGKQFHHLKKNPPRTCSNGDCKYKYQYKIDRHTWADYQPTLFESAETSSK